MTQGNTWAVQRSSRGSLTGHLASRGKCLLDSSPRMSIETFRAAPGRRS